MTEPCGEDIEKIKSENAELKNTIKRLRSLVRTNPAAGLRCLAEALQEPLQCGHPLECLDEEKGCLWCIDKDRIKRAIQASDNGGGSASDAIQDMLMILHDEDADESCLGNYDETNGTCIDGCLLVDGCKIKTKQRG